MEEGEEEDLAKKWREREEEKVGLSRGKGGKRRLEREGEVGF